MKPLFPALIGVLVIAPSIHAQTDPGLAWARLSDGNTTIDAGFQQNPGTGAVTAAHPATGQYTVTFPGAALANWIVQVEAYGPSSNYCNSPSWTATQVTVNCYSAAGAGADSPFTIQAVGPANLKNISFAYAASDGSINQSKSFNKSNQTIVASRGPGNTGDYTISFNGLANGGTFQVAGLSASNIRCTSKGFGSTPTSIVVDISCVNPNGTSADSGYAVSVIPNSATAPAALGFTLADQPTSASYPANPAFASNSGGAVAIARSGTGQYSVTFPGLYANAGGSVRATAYDNGSDPTGNYCSVASWRSPQPTITPFIGTVSASNAVWNLRSTLSAGPPSNTITLGIPGDIPVTGDWTGSGQSGIGVFRPSNGIWYLRNMQSTGFADLSFQFGAPGWIPITGDWTASGKTGIGVFDPSTATWYLRNSPSAGPPDFTFQYGAPGWIPVTGDWTGGGKDGIGVYDPSTATWYARNTLSAGPADFILQYGVPGWIPVTGDWTGTHQTGIGVVDPATETWHLLNGPTFVFGLPGDKPVVGKNVQAPVSPTNLTIAVDCFAPRGAPADSQFSVLALASPAATSTPGPLRLVCNPTTGPATVGAAYTSTCTASGGTAPYSFYISGTVPSWLTESHTATTQTFSGTPTTAGAYNYASIVVDTAQAMQQVNFTGNVAAQGAGAPVLTQLNPSTATAGGAAFTLTVTGTGFSQTAQIQFNGSALSTTWSGATQLIGMVPASMIVIAGTENVTVTQGGATSNALPFTIAPATTTGNAKNTTLPHIAANGPWVTGFYIVNTAATPAQFKISFFSDSGQPLALAVAGVGTGPVNQITGMLPASGSAYYEAGSASLAVTGGDAQVSADASIVVQSLFRLKGSNNTYFEAAVNPGAGSKDFVVPFDVTTFAPTGEQLFTGFAIANADPAQTATVTCVAKDGSGATIPNAVAPPVLQPQGHWAEFNFPPLVGKRGSLECTSATSIVALAIHSFAVSGAISSLPVITK